jgi:hypothetical protein
MEAIAHNASFAKKAGVPQSVGQDFATADKGKKFVKGGQVMAKNSDAGNSKTMQKVATKPGNINGVASKGLTKGKVIKQGGNSIGNGAPVNTMKKGGMAKAMKKGGMAKC